MGFIFCLLKAFLFQVSGDLEILSHPVYFKKSDGSMQGEHYLLYGDGYFLNPYLIIQCWCHDINSI